MGKTDHISFSKVVAVIWNLNFRQQVPWTVKLNSDAIAYYYWESVSGL